APRFQGWVSCVVTQLAHVTPLPVLLPSGSEGGRACSGWQAREDEMAKRRVMAVAVGLAIGLMSAPNAAHAGITTFTNRATWSAAASPNGAENFNGFGADATFQNTSVAISNGTVTGEPGSNGAQTNKIDAPALEFGGVYSIDGTSELLGDVVGSQQFTINFTTPVTAWGADFKGVADGGRTTRIDVFDSTNTLL